MPVKDQFKRVWALFETDEVGKPREKVAGNREVLFDGRSQRQEYTTTSELPELSNQNMGLENPRNTPNFSPSIELMVQDWEVSDLIRTKWQHDITELLTSQQCAWKALESIDHDKLHAGREDNFYSMKPSKFRDKAKEVQGFNTVLLQQDGYPERPDCAFMREDKHEKIETELTNSKDANKELDIVLPTYRLHVEYPDNDDFGMTFAAPLTLSRTLLEQKLSCCGKDLQNVSFLNLNHEGLSSLGESVLSRWCPKTRIFTADMNRLNNLDNAFIGYEETLEQLSLKDNFLCDLNGLECLHKLQVIHLDGNYILQLCASNLYLSEKKSEQESRKNPIPKTVGQRKGKILLPIPLGSAKCPPSLCWRSLREFGVSCNRISKVERLGLLCPKLEVLDLGSNNLVSLGWSEESAFFGLRCLRVLDVGQNQLKGRSLWEGLRHCPLLLSLVASRNRLEELPTHDGSVFLRELWLNGNSIRCFSCTAWLPNLQRLYLQDNEIDTLMPIWGFPALEVLDLSFNKISQVQQLQQLGCFSNLRSLQLNDNPVAELPNYTVRILEAIPWLIELDNEPLTEYSRVQAVQDIFLKVMSTVGLSYVRSNILKGTMPCLGVVDISRQESNMSQEWNSILVNNIVAGDADIHVLWAILVEIHHAYLNISHGKGQNCSSPFLTECHWRLHSFRLMCLDHKKRLFNSSRESASFKGGINESLGSVSEMTLCHPKDGRVPATDQHTEGGISAQDSYITDLQLCMWEHIQFNSSHYEDSLCMNEDYELEIKQHNKRVLRLQALARGFLARRQHRRQTVTVCKQVNVMSSTELCHAAAKIQAYWKRWKSKKANSLQKLREKTKMQFIVKFQALWRGFRTRKRFQMAMRDSKYEDSDDFEYVVVDEADFLPENLVLKEEDVSSANLQYQERYDIHELPSPLRLYFHDAKTAHPYGTQEEKLFIGSHCKGNEAEAGKHLQLLIERKAAVDEITKDWGFSQEKTALQLMRALENTRRRAKEIPKANSQARYNAFISKCAKYNKDLTNPCSLENQWVEHENNGVAPIGLFKSSNKTALLKPKGGKRFVTASVTTLDLSR
eukprot:c17288_g1_i2 orf=559-3783(+)